MGRKFTEFAFTAKVKAVQEQNRSRVANRALETIADDYAELGEREIAFVQERDGFYQATVGENGWPYVQFRGGPAGFLRVLNSKTIGYADFRGNVQYISLGNLAGNDRVAIILMDYANRRRLKLWARAKVVSLEEDPQLISRLEVAEYRAEVQRGIVLTVEAFDWNCPQHITPRFTEREIEATLMKIAGGQTAQKPLPEPAVPISAAQPPLAAAGHALAVPPGKQGDLCVEVAGVRQLTPLIREYELRAVNGGELPDFTPGAHIRVPVQLPGGAMDMRHYSLVGSPGETDSYRIAVKRETGGRGGSAFIHDTLNIGTRIMIEPPRNYFELEPTATHHVLIAGGIGITPLLSMVKALRAARRSFELHYTARDPVHMAYAAELRRIGGNRAHLYFDSDATAARLDMKAILTQTARGSHVYLCGPPSLVTAATDLCRVLGYGKEQVHFELFSPAAAPQGGQSFSVYLARSDKSLIIPADKTLLDGLVEAGCAPHNDCRQGRCGSCVVAVIDGVPEHRDTFLSAAERATNTLICTCISRARTAHLILDL